MTLMKPNDHNWRDLRASELMKFNSFPTPIFYFLGWIVDWGEIGNYEYWR